MSEAYDAKRSTHETPEPAGGDDPGALSDRGRPLFVIHEHDASTHHFDLRLEVDGVLRSWAVPKGPSTDPSEQRLAIATEDHPLSYADFEGVIPEDQYGGGSVIVWDAGTWENLKEADDGDPPSLAEQLDDGHATFRLDGDKVHGGYALTRTSDPDADEERWLLVKMDDDDADARRNPTSTEPESVLSGRTVAQVGDDEGEGHDGGGSS